MAQSNVRKIVFASVIAALYAALTIAVAPIAYGQMQFRVSEVLCILPFFFPVAVPGLFVGCFLVNFFGPYGLPDAIVGSTASLLAAICTMYIGKARNRDTVIIKAAACFPPVLFNALLIGSMIAYFMVTGGEAEGFLPAFISSGLWVGLGQLGVMYAIGLPLMIYLPKTQLIGRLGRLIEGEK